MKINKSQLIVRQLRLEELDVYIKYISYVKAHMEHPEWLGDFSKEDLVALLNNNSHIYIWIFKEHNVEVLADIDQIVASGMIIPSRQKDLIKFGQDDLNYIEVVDFGPETVHPSFIGNGLQTDVIKYLEEVAIKLSYKYALGTVDPDNIYSMRNLINNGFKFVNRVELSRGTRDVLKKEL